MLASQIFTASSEFRFFSSSSLFGHYQFTYEYCAQKKTCNIISPQQIHSCIHSRKKRFSCATINHRFLPFSVAFKLNRFFAAITFFEILFPSKKIIVAAFYLFVSWSFFFSHCFRQLLKSIATHSTENTYFDIRNESKQRKKTEKKRWKRPQKPYFKF